MDCLCKGSTKPYGSTRFQAPSCIGMYYLGNSLAAAAYGQWFRWHQRWWLLMPLVSDPYSNPCSNPFCNPYINPYMNPQDPQPYKP